MTATLSASTRINISAETIAAAQHVQKRVPAGASLLVRTPDGDDLTLPGDVQRMLFAALEALAQGGQVSIGTVPGELTSTVAADMLGVSRPTLMKWVRGGEIQAHKVGTHTRFHRDEVFRVRALRAEERAAAFDALRELDDQNEDLLEE